MIFKLNNIKIYLLLILLAQSSFVLAQQSTQYHLHGVDFKELHLSPIDSAVLRINSTWYSARDQYGEVKSSNETFYSKWTNDKEKYYPIMKEAWKYCIDHQPNQVRLYKDGIWLNIWMLQAMEDSVKRMKYFDETMKVYDMWIQNLDSINKYTKRISDRSSVGGIMMQKARVYSQFIISEDQVYNDTKAQQMFTEAAEIIRRDFNEEKNLGGDIDQGGLEYYLGFAINDYTSINNSFVGAQIPNKKQVKIKRNGNIITLTDTAQIRKMAPEYPIEKLEEIEKHNQYVDSIIKSKNDKINLPKDKVLDRYRFIKDVCEKQKDNISKDYIPTDQDGTDSIDVIKQKVFAPYKTLLDRCEYLMTESRIDLNAAMLVDVENQYTDEFENHKINLQQITKLQDNDRNKLKRANEELNWITNLKDICLRANDFSEDNLSYGFYEDVCKFNENIIDLIASIPVPHNDQRVINIYYTLGKKYHSMGYNSGGGKIRNRTIGECYAAAIYYYNMAIKTDPQNAKIYNKEKAKLTGNPTFKTDMFFAGIKEGQTISVDGENIRVVLR